MGKVGVSTGSQSLSLPLFILLLSPLMQPTASLPILTILAISLFDTLEPLKYHIQKRPLTEMFVFVGRKAVKLKEGLVFESPYISSG